MARVFSYRGKSVEELQQMSLEEFTKLLPARQRRTLTRGLPEVQKKLLEKIRKRKGTEKLIRTRVRDIIILPEMINAKIGIYDGQEYKVITISPEMIGHRLGEFALTRRQVKHGAPGFGSTRGSKYVPLK